MNEARLKQLTRLKAAEQGGGFDRASRAGHRPDGPRCSAV